MLQRVCQSIGSTLGVESNTVIALAPALATGALYAGAATGAVVLRVGSIATEYFGKEEWSDKLENNREQLMSLANKSIQNYAHIILGLTALTTSAVLISNYIASRNLPPTPQPPKVEQWNGTISEWWNWALSAKGNSTSVNGASV